MLRRLLLALALIASPAQAQLVSSLNSMASQSPAAVAITGGAIDGTTVGATTPSSVKSNSVTVASGPLILSGNQSVAAWTTGGVRLKGVSGTLTDTTSSGTVAAAYTDVLGGNTIAASSATTFTDYASLFLNVPSAGTNVTITNPWSLATAGAIKLAPTWNSAGTTFPGAIFANVTDTASASGSLLMDLQVGGSSKFKVDKGGSGTFANGLTVTGNLTASSNIIPGANSYIGWGDDMRLYRDATNTLAQRNGTNAQTQSWYKSYTDASNYSRIRLSTNNGGNYQITADAAGTGATQPLQLNFPSYTFQNTGGTHFWDINSSGHLLAGADNAYDIGASGATRPRTIYFGTNITGNASTSIASSIQEFRANAAGYLGWSGRSFITSPSDGVIRLSNNAETDFSRLQFGGTTSSFPALKRNGTAIDARLADDSAYAPVAASTVQLATAYTVSTLPTAATGKMAYVTDAVACTFLATPTGGGSAFCPVIYNGSAWIAHFAGGGHAANDNRKYHVPLSKLFHAVGQ